MMQSVKVREKEELERSAKKTFYHRWKKWYISSPNRGEGSTGENGEEYI